MSSGGKDYEVGYGKPPKQSRFKPGQSGNPAGRKAGSGKKRTSPAPDVLLPTREALTRRADRLVTVLEDGERHQMTTREAVLGALALAALKGGVLAQRTLIQLMQEEDERRYAKRDEIFTYWRNHVMQARAKIQMAQSHNRPPPTILPHPDDVLLEYATLTVSIIGPVNEEEAIQYAHIRRTALLCLELSRFHREDVHFDPVNLEHSRIGFWSIHHIDQMRLLPPRMRAISKEEDAQSLARAMGRRTKWEAYLRAECEAVGLPYFPHKRAWRTWELGELLSPAEVQAFIGTPTASALWRPPRCTGNRARP